MNFRRHLFLILALAGSTLSVSAQTLKPGLWEMKSKIISGSGEMEKSMAIAKRELAKMPAAQRKMMEDMMAKQGISMDAGAGTTSLKLCMTAEMIARNEMPAQDGDCKQTVLPRTGNSMKFSFICSEPPSSGEGQVTFLNPEAYTMKMQMKTQATGKAESMVVESSGQFLSTACGAIKPLGGVTK